MSHTPYDSSISVAQSALKSLAHLLEVGEQQSNAGDLPAASIHPDMLPLTFQVQMATETAMKLVAFLSSTEPPRFENKLVTFSDMYARIERAQGVLASASRSLINGRIGEMILLPSASSSERAPFSGYALIYGYSLPTIYFHVSIAYGILRKEGVPLKKGDYLDSFGERF